jgi:hypothetical protein
VVVVFVVMDRGSGVAGAMRGPLSKSKEGRWPCTLKLPSRTRSERANIKWEEGGVVEALGRFATRTRSGKGE